MESWQDKLFFAGVREPMFRVSQGKKGHKLLSFRYLTDIIQEITAHYPGMGNRYFKRYKSLRLFSFPKSKRLVRNEQFKAVLAGKRCFRDNFLVLYVAKNQCGYARLGISVGRNCGKAVFRNRLKRLLREVFRQSQSRIASDYDYVVMFSRGAAEGFRSCKDRVTFEQVKTAFLGLLERAGLG